MADPELPDEFARIVRDRKRWTWTQKGAGKEYQYEAFKADPIIRIKNLTEIGFVLAHVRGACILDAGAGTGRFTFPLLAKGFRVAALDISLDMLREGQEQASVQGGPYPCLVGDIERLPFADGTFDGVVSITVLRHFPYWRDILAEYVRVLKVGGRIVFDLASGEQRDFIGRHFPAAPPGHSHLNTMTYEAAATVAEVQDIAHQLGMEIVLATPHDVFHTNPLLDIVLGSGLAEFDAAHRNLLQPEGAQRLYQVLCRRFLPFLSPAISSSWCIVLEKGGANRASYAPPYRGAQTPSALLSHGARLQAILENSLGWRRRACLNELDVVLRDPDAERLWCFWERELLPHIPLEALVWGAR